MNISEDSKIILKIRQGEIDDFSHLVKKYTSKIYLFIKLRLFDKNEVDDLVQNAFVKFYKAIDRFDEQRPVLPYLYEIAKNEMKMYFRSRKETVSLDDKISPSLIGQEKELVTHDTEETLRLLPKDQEQALQLLVDGYSYGEIAKTLNKPLNTIRTIIRRGRLKIKKLYEKS